MSTLKEILEEVSMISLDTFENELQIIRLRLARNQLMNFGHKYTQPLLQLLEFEDKTKVLCSAEKQKKDSEQLRIQGNKMMGEKRKPNLIGAIRAYTLAIFVAPLGETLALAHANRAAALEEFEYYKPAYDDCVLALEQGYPERLKNKLLYRQAYCALKINELELVERHLNDLEKRELTKNFKALVDELRLDLEEMQEMRSKNHRSKKEQSKQHYWITNSHAVVQVTESRGRHLVANKKLIKDEIVCVERASSFVKMGDSNMCENCLSMLFIPFPCKNCQNRVVYCSLKCLQEHFYVHEIECPGMRMDLFSQMGGSQLGLRMMINGLPQLLPLLRKETNIQKLWNKLIFGKTIKSDYGYTLQMQTPFHKMPLHHVMSCAETATIFLEYLKKYTKFFDRLSTLDWTLKQKELLISSLILRHMGQIMVSGYMLSSIVPKCEENNFVSLMDDVWCESFRIKRGKLHVFAHCEQVYAINFPFISIAKHSCDPCITPRFSGRYVRAVATRTIEAGAELTQRCVKKNSIYSTLEYIDSKESIRQFRCEYDDCKKIFFPKDDEFYTMNILCDCGRKQEQAWMAEFNDLLGRVNKASPRRKLFKHFYNLDRWLVNFNMKKIELARHLIRKCFSVLKAGIHFANDEFQMLGDIIQFVLKGTEKLNGISFNYITEMLYLWDIIALGKYKCAKEDMQTMLQAIEVVSDEIKMIFMNYFEDYIKSELI